MRGLPSLLKHFTMPPKFMGWSIEDIEMIMSKDESVFCSVYMESGGNGTKAGAAVRALNPDNTKEYSSTQHKNQLCSSKARDMLYKPTVTCYLYLKLQEVRKKSALHVSRGLEAYVRKYEEIREAALAAEDFGAGLKAHKELGMLYGHTEGQDAGNKANDIQLIAVIAGDDEALRKQLCKQMGIDSEKVIEGEIVRD